MMVQYQQPARCRRGRPNPELNPDFIFVPNPAGVHSDAGFAGFGLAIMCGVRVGIFAGPDAVVTDTVCALRRPEGANSVAPRGLARGRFAGAAACFALPSGAGRTTPRPCFTAPWFAFAPERVERLSIDHYSRIYDSGVGPRLHGSSKASRARTCRCESALQLGSIYTEFDPAGLVAYQSTII
jgi:hypothetical protein